MVTRNNKTDANHKIEPTRRTRGSFNSVPSVKNLAASKFLVHRQGVLLVAHFGVLTPNIISEFLKRELVKHNIAYVFMGKELGARSENPECYIDGKVQYNHLAEKPAFVLELRKLREGMKISKMALMCAEKEPIACG